jgi:hypothetical protein
MGNLQKRLEELQGLLDSATEHFAAGSETWNAIGLDSPQFAVEAARAAQDEYQKAADLLEPSRFTLLSDDMQLLITANRELALAHAASAESFLYDEWSDDGLEKVVELIGQEIDHTEKAIRWFESSSSDETVLTSHLQMRILHSQGRRAGLLGRLASREGKLIEARDFYRWAEEKFRQQMKAYESEAPELAQVETKIREVLNHKQIQRLEKSEGSEEKHGVRWTVSLLRFSDQIAPLSNEDLYRRAASNYYANASLGANLDAFELLNQGGQPADVDKKLEESIELIKLAMESFPGHLEFHRVLFDAWRVRGKLFGCPIEETENFYHTQCPLAIMHFFGSWYASPTIEYDALICTVCGEDILECPHYPGQVVGEQVVQYHPQNPTLISASVVDVPEDPRCRIEWISIPKDHFPPPPENDPGLRCLICQQEEERGKMDLRLVDLPDWIEEKIDKRYEQIRSSKGYRVIHLDREPKNQTD